MPASRRNRKRSLLVRNEYDPEADVILFSGTAQEFLGSIPSESVDLIVSSPPYNIGKKYEQNADMDAYLAEQLEVLRELNRVLKHTGSICWQVGNRVQNGELFPLDFHFYELFRSLGLKLRNRIIWRFGHGLHARNRFSGRYEMILWFTKSQDYTFDLDAVRVPAKYPNKRVSRGPRRGELSGNPKGVNPSDVWEVIAQDWESGIWNIPNVKARHPEKTEHPCQFPIELVERCVLALSRPGERVLDPYMGVGSSVLAALKHNRTALGSDKEDSYVSIARERVEALVRGELKVRQLGKPVLDPKNAGPVASVPSAWRDDKDSIYYQGPPPEPDK